MAMIETGVLRQLADGRFHSGQQLADAAGVSRAAVWKQMQRLQAELGIEIHAVRGRGYRLASPLELLDVETIDRGIDDATRDVLERIEIHSSVASTNLLAADRPPSGIDRGVAWLAEHQTAGRGRRGRHWISAYGSNIYLSLAWYFDMPMAGLSALSLAAGVAVAEALADHGLRGHNLKWPNDVQVDGRKLAGVLVDVSGEAAGPVTAVIGVGVNLRLPPDSAKQIDQPWVDLSSLLKPPPSRNRLAATLIVRLVDTCRRYRHDGFASSSERWRAYDSLHGCRVRLHSGERYVDGVYAGVAIDGALLLDGPGGRSQHYAGEVSLRLGETS